MANILDFSKGVAKKLGNDIEKYALDSGFEKVAKGYKFNDTFIPEEGMKFFYNNKDRQLLENSVPGLQKRVDDNIVNLTDERLKKSGDNVIPFESDEFKNLRQDVETENNRYNEMGSKTLDELDSNYRAQEEVNKAAQEVIQNKKDFSDYYNKYGYSETEIAGNKGFINENQDFISNEDMQRFYNNNYDFNRPVENYSKTENNFNDTRTIIDDNVTKRFNSNYVEDETVTDTNKKRKGTSPEIEQLNRLDREKKQATEDWNNIKDDDEARQQWFEKNGIEGDNTDADAMNFINNQYKKGLDSGPNIRDKIWGNKIPQAAIGLGTTAWLVSAMSSRKGQQSNAELYGQQAPYGQGGGGQQMPQ